MAERTKDLGANVVCMAQHLNQRFGKAEASQARLSADIAHVRADILDVRAEHGDRFNRIEGEIRDLKDGQRQIVEAMNESFGRLFAMLKKNEEAAE